MATDDMAEEWRPINEFPGYEVSSRGRLRSLPRWVSYPASAKARKPYQRWYTGEFFDGSPNKDGYLRVTLPPRVTKFIHILVCETFHGPRPSPKHEVAHWDGDKTNNRPSNLRWATSLENKADSERLGTRTCGEAVNTAKLTAAQIREIRARYSAGETQVSLAAEFGVYQPTLSKIVLRKVWRHID